MAHDPHPDWQAAADTLRQAEHACWAAASALDTGRDDEGRELSRLAEALARLTADLSERCFRVAFARRPDPIAAPARPEET